jgi:hypothetical protein
MRIVNHLTRQAKRSAAMATRFKRHVLGTLFVIASLAIIEALVIWAGWKISLAIPFGVLCWTVYRYSGLRGALASALIVSLYAYYHLEWYGWNGFAQVIAGAFLIAGPSGLLKRSFREAVLEAEANQRKAELVDSLNGNIKKVLQSLATLDDLKANLGLYSRAKALEEVDKARAPLITLITLVESWQEINKSREAAFAYLSEIGRYPYKVDDIVREIRSLQFELLNRVDYLGKTLEKAREEKSD